MDHELIGVAFAFVSAMLAGTWWLSTKLATIDRTLNNGIVDAVATIQKDVIAIKKSIIDLPCHTHLDEIRDIGRRVEKLES